MSYSFYMPLQENTSNLQAAVSAADQSTRIGTHRVGKDADFVNASLPVEPDAQALPPLSLSVTGQ